MIDQLFPEVSSDTLMAAFIEYEQIIDGRTLDAFERVCIQMTVSQKHGLGPFDLEKVITAVNAVRLLDELMAEHQGKYSIPNLQYLLKRYYAVPNHDRDAPSLVVPLVLSASCTPEAAKEMLAYAWTIPEWPQRDMEQDWTAAFEMTGFVTDGEDITPPTEATRLYRGAWEDHKYGMAWTTDLDKAQWFARRFDGPGKVWTVEADPDLVLARFEGRNESEWVLDMSVMDTDLIEEWRAV